MQPRQDKLSTQNIILYVLGLLPVIWIGLLIAPYMDGGIPSIIEHATDISAHPFNISFCKDSIRTVLTLCLIYAVAIGIYLASAGKWRRREEHGSAEWGKPERINKKYEDASSAEKNKILTQNVRIGLDDRNHRRNINTLVIGGSGAGKTRFFAKPNILQGNTSFVVLDPKGEILNDTGNFLKMKGYKVKVIDLIEMDKSHCYNPFVYIREDNDIQKIVTNLFKNTTPKGATSQDPFWDQAAQMLLLALMFFLWYEAPPDEQNFSMVLDMIRAGSVREEDEDFKAPLDILFDKLADKDPDHIALKYYRAYHSGAGKTLKSIQITLLARLEKFNLPKLAEITQTDDLDLPSLGKQKTALFAVIPDSDKSFNFLVGMLYTQLFQQLYFLADHSPKKRLPIPVHFLMDEFANVALPDEFENLLSTMRSRGISVSIILQNMAQIKALFEKTWESITGNCDEMLYLGGNEQSTHKYISERLGKETIDMNTYGESKGRNGSFSTNRQITGRELLTPDEVAKMDNRYAILFIRGENPVFDLKYDILKHPNVRYTTDGKGSPYIHGLPDHSVVEVEITAIDSDTIIISDDDIVDYDIISSAEIEDLLETIL